MRYFPPGHVLVTQDSREATSTGFAGIPSADGGGGDAVVPGQSGRTPTLRLLVFDVSGARGCRMKAFAVAKSLSGPGPAGQLRTAHCDRNQPDSTIRYPEDAGARPPTR